MYLGFLGCLIEEENRLYNETDFFFAGMAMTPVRTTPPMSTTTLSLQSWSPQYLTTTLLRTPRSLNPRSKRRKVVNHTCPRRRPAAAVLLHLNFHRQTLRRCEALSGRPPERPQTSWRMLSTDTSPVCCRAI